MNNFHKKEHDALLISARQKRLPHALLVTGPEGIGKYDFALSLANAMLCENRTEDNRACGTCTACRLLNAGTYPDFYNLGLESDEEGKIAKEIKIDQVRSLCNKLSLSRARSALKIAIINPAERMNSSSSNSLLKTLEEPTADTLIVLVSSHPTRLPVTVRSRCQTVLLKAPAKEAVIAFLKKEVPEQDAEVLFALGNGAPRLALEAAAFNLVSIRQDFLNDLFKLSERKLDAIHTAQKWHKSQPENVLSWFISWVQDFIRFNLTQNTETIFNSDFVNQLQNLESQADLSAMLKFLDQLLKAKQLLTRSVNIELLFETLMLNWAELFSPITKRG